MALRDLRAARREAPTASRTERQHHGYAYPLALIDAPLRVSAQRGTGVHVEPIDLSAPRALRDAARVIVDIVGDAPQSKKRTKASTGVFARLRGGAPSETPLVLVAAARALLAIAPTEAAAAIEQCAGKAEEPLRSQLRDLRRR